MNMNFHHKDYLKKNSNNTDIKEIYINNDI